MSPADRERPFLALQLRLGREWQNLGLERFLGRRRSGCFSGGEQDNSHVARRPVAGPDLGVEIFQRFGMQRLQRRCQRLFTEFVAVLAEGLLQHGLAERRIFPALLVAGRSGGYGRAPCR